MEQHEQFQVLVKPVTARMGGANALVFTGSFSKVSQLSRSYGKRKKSPFLGKGSRQASEVGNVGE